MSQVLRGPLTVLGRLLLCTIFLLAAVGNKIPHFSDVAKVMESVAVPAPQFLLAGAIVFLLVGSLSVIVGYKARSGAVLLLTILVLASYSSFHGDTQRIRSIKGRIRYKIRYTGKIRGGEQQKLYLLTTEIRKASDFSEALKNYPQGDSNPCLSRERAMS